MITTPATMTSTYSQSTLAPRSFGAAELKAALVEPLLVVGVSAFWLVTLPVAAISLFAVKIWDTAAGFARGPVQTNPLILRRGQPSTGMTSPAHPAAAKRA
jgi:hypothetical protein